MVILIASAAASVVVGILAFDLFKSRQLKKRLAAGEPLPSAIDRWSDEGTNQAVIQQQANAANASSWGMP